MNESRESKNAEQLEELLLLTEEIQEELEQKDQLIVELKTQLNESLTLNEKLNKENRAGNIQALKNDLKLADRALRNEKEKLRSANVTIEECQDKIRCLTQQRDYARTHQKIVEIPVEKPVLYEKCEACDRTAYQNAKAKYETQKERLAGQYKAKTVMFQTTLFLLAWYSLTTTLFQAVQSDVFLSDCKSFFHDAASFIQTFIGWTIDAGQSVAQISTKIPNEIIAGIIYWLLLILVVGICVAGTGILAILIEIKVIELYKKNCWDVITLLMILTSAAVIIYFGEVIKKALSINLLNSIMLGGDAFITKPYNPAILLAKNAALLKKAYRSSQTEIYMWKEATLHLESSMIEYKGQKAELTKNELKILDYLFKNAGKICSRNDIVDFLWIISFMLMIMP